MCKNGGMIDIETTTSLTFLFGITTFGIADELLAETLGLEAAPVEVEVLISIILLIEWEMNGYQLRCAQYMGKESVRGAF